MVAATQFSFLVLLMAAMASTTSAQSPTANTTTADTTTAGATVATTTLSTLAASSSPASAASGSAANASSPTASGPTAAPGTGPTTTAAPAGSAAAPTTPRPYACLHCNGTNDSNDPCRTAAANFGTIINCDTGCWVYREENSTSGQHTISRGCAAAAATWIALQLMDTECTLEKQSGHCDDANNIDITVCRRCCTTHMCNHAALTLPGSVGTPTAYVSTVVIVTSFIMAVFSNDLLL